jgi:hypothetical protein
MIYDKSLNTSFKQTKKFNLTGCKNLYLTETKNVAGYSFAGRQIAAFDRSGNFSLMQNLSWLNMAVKTLQSKNGTLYDISISFSIGVLNTDVTYLLEALLNAETTAIIEDKNGRFFLVGFRQGFITEYEAKTEEGSYAVKMNTKQISLFEEVSVSAMQSLTLAKTDADFTPEPIYQTPVTSTESDRTYNTKVVTVNNYAILESHDFVLLPSALNVFLPTTARTGKQLIIKCDYDASYNPSFVRGQVDNNTVVEMNTDRASITVVWNGSRWSTTATE